MVTGRGMLVTGWVMLAAGLLSVVASLGTLRLNYGMADVRGGSMAPAYRLGDDVVYARVDGDEVRRGDVVLFSAPDRYPGAGSSCSGSSGWAVTGSCAARARGPRGGSW